MNLVTQRLVSVLCIGFLCLGTPTTKAVSVLNLDMTGSTLFGGTGSSLWFNGYTQTGYGLVALQFSGSLDPSVQTLFFTGTAYDGTPVNISGSTFSALNTNMKKVANHFSTINTGKYYKAGNYMLGAYDASGSLIESLDITADRSLLIPTDIITLDTNKNGKIDAVRVLYAGETLSPTTDLVQTGIYLVSQTGGLATHALDYETPWTAANVDATGVTLHFGEYDLIRTNLVYSPDTHSDIRLKWAMDVGVRHQYGLPLAAYDTYSVHLSHGSSTGLILDGGIASGQTLSFESLKLTQDLILSGSVLSGTVAEPLIEMNGHSIQLSQSALNIQSLRIGSGNFIFDTGSRINAEQCLHSELGTGGTFASLSGSIICQSYTGTIVVRPITVPGSSASFWMTESANQGKKNSGAQTLICPQMSNTGAETVFGDMTGKQWINTLETNGIVEGYQTQTGKVFRPNDEITLHQTIKMIEALEKPLRFGQDSEWEQKLEKAHPKRFQRTQAKRITQQDVLSLLAEYPDATACFETKGQKHLNREEVAQMIWTVGTVYTLFSK